MDFIIRPATQEDYAELGEIFATGDALHSEALPHVFREPDGPARSKRYISAVISDQNTALFVAESDGHIIGLVQAYIQKAPDIPLFVPRRYATIDNIAVLEEFRRSGVGQALVEKVERWAAGKKVSQIELNVWEFNAEAIAFYDKLGYTTSRRTMSRLLE